MEIKPIKMKGFLKTGHTSTAWDENDSPWAAFYIPVGMTSIMCSVCGAESIEKGWINLFSHRRACHTCVEFEKGEKDNEAG